MTSKWTQSAPPASTELTSSPSRAKSADRIEGAMMASIFASLSPHSAGRANRLVRLLNPLGLLLGHLRHRLRKPVGDQFVRVVTAHLPPVRLLQLLVADVMFHLEF